jgi:hypothetical protein
LLTFTDAPGQIAWVPHDRAQELSFEHQTALRNLALAFARAQGSVETEGFVSEAPSGALGMLVPRTRFHIRLAVPDRDELNTLLKLAAALFLGSGGNIKVTSLSALYGLRSRISALRPEYGERSVAEIIMELGRATAADITLRLQARECPYLDSKCRYLEGKACMIKEPDVTAIISDLIARAILVQRTSAEPPEFSIVF